MFLRAASDFVAPYPGRSAIEIRGSVAMPIAVENAYRIGSTVTRDIIRNWEVWNAE